MFSLSVFKKATRDAVGKALVKLGEENENVVVLDADLSGSTKTIKFKEKFPSRFFNCGIAECNMVGVAAGLSCVGKIPFVASFSVFVVERALEQIRNSVCYNNLNVKIIGAHSGFSAGADGASHQALEDIALLRAIPNVTILSPCDYVETFAAIENAAKIKGPVYIRTGKFEVENVNSFEYLNEFEINKAVILKEGDFVCLIATGLEVYYSLKAAEILEAEGISTMVVNVSTIKPIDKELILKLAEQFKFLFTVEEHNVVGGLGDAVAGFLSEVRPKLITKIGVQDRFGESGDVLSLLKKNGLDEIGIYKKVKSVVARKIFQ